MNLKRGRGDSSEQAADLEESSASKKQKLEPEAIVPGLDLDELPVTATANGSSLRGQVRKGRDCPYLDTISRQVQPTAGLLLHA